MNKEDYSKYYIQGSDHYLIPKDIFNELFNEMSNWREDTKKYKEVIDKAIEFIKSSQCKYDGWEITNQLYENEIKQLLDILNEVSE